MHTFPVKKDVDNIIIGLSKYTVSHRAYRVFTECEIINKKQQQLDWEEPINLVGMFWAGAWLKKFSAKHFFIAFDKYKYYKYIYICDRLQENRAQRGILRKFFFALQSCRCPDIELSKFYRRSLSRSHYNRPIRSLPSAWNNTFLRNRSIFSRYLRTPRCARFSGRRSHISYILYLLHPRYLHNDIFRYMTREITQDISLLLFHAVLASSLPL